MAKSLQDVYNNRKKQTTQKKYGSLKDVYVDRYKTVIMSDISAKIKDYETEVKKYGDIYNSTFFDSNGKAKTGYIGNVGEQGKQANIQSVNIIQKRNDLQATLDKWADYLNKDYVSNVNKYLATSNDELTKLSENFKNSYEYYKNFQNADEYKQYEDYLKQEQEKTAKEKEYIANFDANSAKKELDKLRSLYDSYSDWGKDEVNRNLMPFGYSTLRRLENDLEKKESDYGMYLALTEKYNEKPEEFVTVDPLRAKGQDNLAYLKASAKATEKGGYTVASVGNEQKDVDVYYFKKHPEEKFATFATDKEYGVYSRLKEKGEDKAAEAYAKSLDDQINTRMSVQLYEELYKNSPDKYPFTFQSGVTGAFEQTKNFFDSLDSVIHGEELETSVPLETQVQSQIISNAKGVEKFVLESLGTTAAMAPVVLSNYIPGIGTAMSSIMLYSQASGAAISDAKSKGYTDEQAMQYGTLIGAAELALEKFLGGLPGISKLSSKAVKTLEGVDNLFYRLAGKGLLSGASELTEEFAQAYLEPYIATIVADEDYDPPALLEALYQGLIGMATGVGMSTVAAIPGEVNTYMTGEELMQTPDLVEKLANVGANIPQTANLAAKVSTNPTAYKTGRLYERVGQAVTPENEEGTRKYTRLNNQLFSVVEQSPAVSAEAADRINMAFTQAIDKTELPEKAKSVIAQKFVLPSNIEPNSYEAEMYARDFADDAALAYEAGEIQQKTGEKLPDGWLQQNVHVATPEQVDYYTKFGRERVLAEQVENAQNGELKQKNNFDESNIKYSLNSYSQHQIDNWSNNKNIIIYENDNQLRQFIDGARKGENLSQKIYFGAIPKSLALRIKKDTGVEVENFNCTLRASEIRKIISDHGNERTESLRGQRAVVEDDFIAIPQIIQSPDEIRLSDKQFEGKPVIEFVKTINGRTTVVSYVSKKHLDLTVQTMYSGIKKGNLATAAGDQAPANTPEAHVGTVPNNSIFEKSGNVNRKYSTPIGQYTADTTERVQARKKLLARSADEVRTVTRNDTTLTAEQREAAEFGEKIGVAVGFVDTTQYYSTKRDGISLKSKGIIILDKKTENPLKQVFIHELGHFSETSKTYAKLSKKIMESKALENWLTEKGYKGSFTNKKSAYRAEKKRAYSENGVALTKDGADAEMIANFLGETIGTEEKFNVFMSELTKEQKKNFLDYIKEVIDWFKATFTNSVPAEIRQIESLYKKAVRESAESVSKLVNSQDTEAYSINFNNAETNKKIKRGMTDEERYKLLKNKRIKLTAEVNQEKMSKSSMDFNLDEQTIETLEYTTRRKLIKRIGEQFGVFKEYSNTDVNLEFQYTKGNLKESVNKQKGEYYNFVKMLSCFDEVISNAIGIEVHNRNDIKYKSDDTLKDVYVLASAFVDGNNIIPVKLEIKEFFDKKNTLYVAIALKSVIKNGVVTQEVADNSVAQQYARPSDISLSELFKNVNPQDESFYKYIPKQFLEEAELTGEIDLINSFEKVNTDEQFFVPGEEIVERKERTYGNSIPERTRKLRQEYADGKIGFDELVAGEAKLMEEAREKYGTIEEGENSQERVKVPQGVEKNKNVSQYVRTILETGVVSEALAAEIGEKTLLGEFSHKVATDKNALEDAEKAIKNGTAKEKWYTAVGAIYSMPTKNQIAVGEKLLEKAMKDGKTTEALEIASDLVDVYTRAGQLVQSARLLKQMTGTGRLIHLQRTVNRINEDIQKKNEKIKNENKKHPEIKIGENLAEELVKTNTAEEVEEIAKEIEQDVANQMKVTWLDKWNAWRYLSMLGNPLTHARNVVGNGIFLPVVSLQKVIGTGMESFIPAEQRTRALKVDKAYREFAENDVKSKDVQDILDGTDKMTGAAKAMRNRRIFKSKILHFLSTFNKNALSAEDAVFKNYYYKTALASFLQARNVDLSNVSEEQLSEARVFAINEALKSTYNDLSKTALYIKKLEKSGKLANIVVNGFVPFKQTPINIIKRGVEYSPLGLGYALTVGVHKVGHGQITASQFIDSVSAGGSGTIAFAIGALLSSLGWVTGGFGDDDEDRFKKLAGEQEYSLQVFGKSYTLDWAAPISIPFFIGVELINSMRKKNYKATLQDISDVFWNSLDPIVNLSMLSGIENTISSMRYADKAEMMGAAFESVFSSYFGQAVPTIGGKIAGITDDLRRSNYIDKNSQVPSFLQRMYNSAIAKIPGVSDSRNPYIDAWGRTVSQGGVVERFLENFISPGYFSDVDYTDVDMKLLELFEATGETSMFPDSAAKYVIVNKVRKELTADEYVKYAAAKGQYSFAYLKEFFDSNYAKELTPEEQIKAIEKIYKYANEKAKAVVSEYDVEKNNKTAYKEEEDGRSVVDYFSNKVKAERYAPALYNQALDDGDMTEADRLKAEIIEWKMENGKTERDADSELKSAVTSYWKPLYIEAYIEENTAEVQRIRNLLEDTGYYPNLNSTIREWYNDYKRQQREKAK